jgi:hypothetical protein
MTGFLKTSLMLFVCSVFVSLPLDANAGKETGAITFRGVGDSSSCPEKPWTPEEEALRTRSAYVEFGQSFTTTPIVFLSVTRLDANTPKSNIRYYVHPESISPYGFIVKFGTWCHTYIYTAQISWLALE